MGAQDHDDTHFFAETNGGAFIQGGVHVDRGDFVGRDKYVLTPDLARDVSGLESPYLGLRAFSYEDRRSFAGREAVIEQAVSRLTEPGAPKSLLFVTGASGSGKSSLVQAGI